MAGIAPLPIADYYSDDDDFEDEDEDDDLGGLDFGGFLDDEEDDTDDSADIFGYDSTDVEDSDDLSPPLFLTALGPTAPTIPGTTRVAPSALPIPPVTAPKIRLNVLPKTPTVPSGLPLPVQPIPTTVPSGLPLPVQPMPTTVAPAVIPQLLPRPKIQPLAGAAVPTIVAPSVPTLKAMPKPVEKKAVTDISEIITKLEGISITGVTPPPADIPANIEDILLKEADETPENFEARKRLTYQVASIPDYGINPLAAVNIGHMWMKKTVLGITYDGDIEAALSRILTLLER